jgi:hypothetical protein
MVYESDDSKAAAIEAERAMLAQIQEDEADAAVEEKEKEAFSSEHREKV